MRMLASARLEPSILESRRTGQDVAIILRNTFTAAMSGTISISDQQAWEIAPRQQAFSIPPGAEGRIPIRVGLSRSTGAGPTELNVHLDWIAGESYATDLPLRMRVDWPDVLVTSSWRFARSVETGRIDVVVTVAVTNRSQRSLDLEAFSLAREFTQTRRPILKLGPNETAVRVFQFADGARRLSGSTIFAGVNELDGERRLTQQLLMPPLLPRTTVVGASADE
jgi:hypothetical protein